MLIVSATRVRPVVANDYRKWLILIFYSFFCLTKLKFPFCLLRGENKKRIFIFAFNNKLYTLFYEVKNSPKLLTFPFFLWYNDFV